MNQNKTKPNASVVIPVYNGEGTVPQLTERLLKVLPELFEKYEILLVDDCSPDGSWQVLKELQKKDPETVRAIHLSRNFGQHNATLCGIRAARYEICITMDDDSYYNRMPADDFFCAYGEKHKFTILIKDMAMPTSCDECPFFNNMVYGICSLLHKEYDLREIGLRMRECPLVVVEEKETGGQKVFIEVAGKENE